MLYSVKYNYVFKILAIKPCWLQSVGNQAVRLIALQLAGYQAIRQLAGYQVVITSWLSSN